MIGLRKLKDLKGASGSRQMAIYVAVGDGAGKERSGSVVASVMWLGRGGVCQLWRLYQLWGYRGQA